MKNNDAGFVFIVGILAIVLLFIAMGTALKNKKESERNLEIFVESNSIGCNRYRYNGSYYWKCGNRHIDSVDVVVNQGRNQTTVNEPVIK